MRQPDLSFLVQRQESLGDDAPLPLLPQEPSFAPLEAVEAAAQLPQDDPLAILIAELRNYQAELEVQNQVLNYSQAVAESASERFEALFASVPLPLLVLDDAHDMVIQANAMALNAFQPQGSDRLLASFMPFVCPADRDRVQFSEDRARTERLLADSDYLAREIAALRLALGDVATRDYVRSELRDQVDDIITALDKHATAQRKVQRKSLRRVERSVEKLTELGQDDPV